MNLWRNSKWLVVGLALAAFPAEAATVAYHASLSAADEVPPTGTAGTGKLSATFDPDTKDFDYKVEYQGLTGPASAAHFHAPASKGQNAPVSVPMTGSLASPIAGKTKLTSEQSDALSNGKMYFNVHTEAHKSGEIRGQLEQGQ